MKALRIYRDAVVNLEEVCEAEVGINDVKIKVIACGICGSDIPRVLNNKAHYYPIILGHEISGVVSDIGINVKDICVGDHVVVVPLLPCFKCDDCINGNYSLCKYYSFIGSRTQGGMAEYISVPQNNVIKINKNIDLHNAALIEPLTVALHGFKQNNYISGGKVAILGMGTIGCFCAQIARIKDAKNITAFVRNDKYNELALKCGVDNIINTSSSDWQSEFRYITDNRGYDYIFETAGSTQTMKQAFEIAANKAHICYIGTSKQEITFNVSEWEQINRKEFYLTGSWMSYSKPFPGDEWKEAVSLLSKDRITIYPQMIHSKTILKDSENVFDDFKNNCSVNGRKLIIME